MANLTRESIRTALLEAHIPSLMAALVHLTGDASHLLPEHPPVYDFFGDGQGDLPDAVQADIRQRAEDALVAHLIDGRPLPPAPPEATIRQVMDFIAGVDIPEHYVPFLLEELGLDGRDAKQPDWRVETLAPKRNLSAIIVGAGMSGLLAAIRLRQAGVAVRIIEKNAEVGGTWFENSYPGCRVDNPNHLYGYSFEPSHEWPQHYSTQPVLLDYFRGVAAKHGLREHVRFETKVEDARWDEAASKWRVTVTQKGATESLEADLLVSAVGQLNQPRLPDVAGRDSFAGDAFHSARWRHDVDLAGKRVAVIGTGASAFQFVPEIAGKVASLTVFQRTPPWLGPTPNYHDDVGGGMRWMLEHVPTYESWYRFWLFWMLTDGIYEMVKADPAWDGDTTAISAMNAELRAALVEKIQEQIGDAPHLRELVVPSYPIGGKRTVRDNGVWLAALKRDNVEVVTNPIAKISPTGIETEDGASRDFDAIVYGTGFTASDFLSTFKVYGRGGVELHDRWQGDARAYLGLTVPGFPNFFMLYGPNTNIVVNGSIIFFSECGVRYVVGAAKLLLDEGAKSLEVREAVHDRFNADVDAANADMAWGQPGVTSWYKNAGGRVSQNWPWPLVDYWRVTLAPKAGEFVFDR
ncbi:FAD-dependent oxidoreductase [Sphingoaurantiacus capsulatus]|uniref:FAD-dependent oxidoreductase n=1 Tax=Sphingoaurantiacus capsulatus TaxID=1771310 RepID=A0ABV7XGW4_9SPHN